MGLLNYTTQITAEKTLGEIQGMLAGAGAVAILTEFDATRNVSAIAFKVATTFGLTPFRLPINVDAVAQILNNQVRDGKIPRRFHNDREQARRVGWRIIRQWLEAQLAIVETQMVTIEQVFLPYAQTDTGETLYERMVIQKFNGLLLEHHAAAEV